jgi:hypothetical protein
MLRTPGKETIIMVEQHEFMGGLTTRPFLKATLRGLAPSLFISVAGTLLIYSLLRPHFAPASVLPLLFATLFPLLGNAVSLLRHRRLDIFGIVVLIGLVAAILAALLGGGQRLLLIRESFVTGALGLACFVSLLLPHPLGYYFARQLLTAHDPEKRAGFTALWQERTFQRAVRVGTIFWGVLLVGDFVLAVILVLTLPVVVVLALAPVALNGIRLGGVAISLIGGRRLLRRQQEERGCAAIVDAVAR